MVHANSLPANVLIIMGSIRAHRRCPEIASWVSEIGVQASDLRYELIDLADWPLPMDDEPGIPALGVYTQLHTSAWSAKINAAQAYIFVTPQYNWGYPAVLKNAIDHLYKEWQDKPCIIVTYGGHGGDKCAAQLRQVAEAVGMRPVATMPGIGLTRAMIGGGPINPSQDFNSPRETILRAIAELVDALKHKPMAA